jgi:hypothetical protein
LGYGVAADLGNWCAARNDGKHLIEPPRLPFRVILGVADGGYVAVYGVLKRLTARAFEGVQLLLFTQGPCLRFALGRQHFGSSDAMPEDVSAPLVAVPGDGSHE